MRYYQSIIPDPGCWSNWSMGDNSGNAMTRDMLLGFINNMLLPVLRGQDVLNANGLIKIKAVTVTPWNIH